MNQIYNLEPPMVFGEEDGFKGKPHTFTSLIRSEKIVLYKLDFSVYDIYSRLCLRSCLELVSDMR